MRWSTPVLGAPVETSAPEARPPRRSALLGRSAVAPIALALTTATALAAAIVALLPAVVRRPAGRLGATSADGVAAPEGVTGPLPE